MPVITLTTDFGYRDGYVGAMKGVIARLAPSATVVDIAHDIPRGDVAHAAWVVKTSTVEFPEDTIHVVVVDPGVGTERAPVIARSRLARQVYVGPDNGVFAHVPIAEVNRIESSHLGAISATFHGRDVFAPAAAAIASGDHRIFGPQVTLTGELPWGPRTPFTGHIIHVDVYGNLITNLPPDEVGDVVAIGDRPIAVVRTYADVATGELLAYTGSAGTLEIAVRDGNAQDELDARRGHIVTAKPPSRATEGPYR